MNQSINQGRNNGIVGLSLTNLPRFLGWSWRVCGAAAAAVCLLAGPPSKSIFLNF